MVECLSTADARKLLREVLENGIVHRTNHFLDQLLARKLDFVDAIQVMRSGTIYRPPEQDQKTGDWKYLIEGYTPDQEWLGILFCFRTTSRTNLITIYGVEVLRRR